MLRRHIRALDHAPGVNPVLAVEVSMPVRSATEEALPVIATDRRPAHGRARRAQLAAAEAAEASQLALFAVLHDDRRPPFERTASGRYLQPGLFENKVTNKGEPQPFAVTFMSGPGEKAS
jgi:hypothetical protein